MGAVLAGHSNYRSLQVICVCFLVAYAVALDPLQSWDAAKALILSAAMMPTAYSKLISSRCLQAEYCCGKVDLCASVCSLPIPVFTYFD
jgi:hypothetical protein